MRTRIKHTILLLLLPLVLLGCTKDRREDFTGNGQVRVVFKLNLPPSGKPQMDSRALGSTDENYIQTIDIYPFVETDGGDYVYNGKVVRVDKTAGDNPVTQFEALLIAYPDRDQKLLIVVNARDAATNYGIQLREDIETAKKKLEIARPTEWKTTGSSDFTPLPMYAETTAQTIRENTTAVGPFTLVRMLARFDVTVKAYTSGSDPASADPKLVLANVQLFNRKTKGTVWYDTSPANWHTSEKRTKTPNMPDGTYESMTEFTPGTVFEATGGVSRRQLYTFEAPYQADEEKRTAVIIGGYYNGAAQIPANLTYYRIDVPQEVTDGHILRNCWYNIEVQKAEGLGANTAEEAFFGAALVTATIDVYTPANQYVTDDGQYLFSTNRGDFFFFEEAEESELVLKTDNPAGITIDPDQIVYTPAVTGSDRWITLTDDSGSDGSQDRKLKLAVSANSSTDERSAKVKVNAGNFEYTVSVKQLPESRYEFDVAGPADNYQYWGGTQDMTVTSIVKEFDDEGNVVRNDAPWTAEFSTNNGTTWTTTAPDWLRNFTAKGAGGSAATYEVVPKAFPPETTNSEDRGLRMNEVEGTHEAPWDLSTKNGYTPMNTANCYIIDAPGYYKFPLVYGNAIKDGVDNRAAYNPSGNASATFLKEFVRHDGRPITGPYIYRQAKPADATVVWMDAPDLVTDVRLIDDGTSLAFVIEKEYVAQGNAIVAVRDADGTILWSWHIWVTPLLTMINPGTSEVKNHQAVLYHFMNYNLGWCTGKTVTYGSGQRSVQVRISQDGISDTAPVIFTLKQYAGSVTTGDNNPFWQWGRKDPIRAGDGLTISGDKILYGPYSFSMVAGTATFAEAIITPHVFYSQDRVPIWCSSGSFTNLWSAENTLMTANDNPVVKTVYDPSPAGFTLPAANAWTGFTTTGTTSNTVSEFNVSGAWNKGWTFFNYSRFTNPSDYTTKGITFYPATGIRQDNGMGNFGYMSIYWSALPQSATTSYALYIAKGYDDPLFSTSLSGACSIRPVKEK